MAEIFVNFEVGQVERYLEREVSSFARAVEEAKGSDVVLVDVDGTLIRNPFVKLPVVSLFVEPNIHLEEKNAFLDLVSAVGSENVAVVTNRNSGERVLWNSHRVVSVVRGLLEEVGCENLFENLNRQLKGNTLGDNGRMVEFLLSKAKNGHLSFSCIEDKSILSLSRRGYWEGILKQLQGGGIKAKVHNFLIAS